MLVFFATNHMDHAIDHLRLSSSITIASLECCAFSTWSNVDLCGLPPPIFFPIRASISSIVSTTLSWEEGPVCIPLPGCLSVVVPSVVWLLDSPWFHMWLSVGPEKRWLQSLLLLIIVVAGVSILEEDESGLTLAERDSLPWNIISR